MQCKYCNYPNSKVVETTHNAKDHILRRRECLKCGMRYTTTEAMKEPKFKTSPPNKILPK